MELDLFEQQVHPRYQRIFILQSRYSWQLISFLYHNCSQHVINDLLNKTQPLAMLPSLNRLLDEPTPVFEHQYSHACLCVVYIYTMHVSCFWNTNTRNKILLVCSVAFVLILLLFVSWWCGCNDSLSTIIVINGDWHDWQLIEADRTQYGIWAKLPIIQLTRKLLTIRMAIGYNGYFSDHIA